MSFVCDHGTDFATWVAGMPVNLRMHGHGQGYTDLNFIIPGLISRVDYWKGPYYANIGNFSSAGGAFMHYYDRMKEGIAVGSGGDYGYGRALLAGSADAGPGVPTYGLEYLHNDGPWEVPDNFRKANAVLRCVMQLARARSRSPPSRGLVAPPTSESKVVSAKTSNAKFAKRPLSDTTRRIAMRHCSTS